MAEIIGNPASVVTLPIAMSSTSESKATNKIRAVGGFAIVIMIDAIHKRECCQQ